MKLYLSLFLAIMVSSTCLAQDSKPHTPLTTISFDETEFNFGEIEDGEVIQNVFRFTNTGSVPLIITNAKGSCGCTVPNWPKAPILPGESSNLLVKFNSKNKKGQQSKRVTITTNTDPAQTFLLIKGEILKKENPIELKPQEKEELKTFDLSGKRSPNSIKLYPNPTSDILNINLSEHQGNAATIDIFNSLGQRMFTQTIDKLTDEDYPIDLDNYTSGTYVVSIKIDGMSRIAKQFSVVKN